MKKKLDCRRRKKFGNWMKMKSWNELERTQKNQILFFIFIRELRKV